MSVVSTTSKFDDFKNAFEKENFSVTSYRGGTPGIQSSIRINLAGRPKVVTAEIYQESKNSDNIIGCIIGLPDGPQYLANPQEVVGALAAIQKDHEPAELDNKPFGFEGRYN